MSSRKNNGGTQTSADGESVIKAKTNKDRGSGAFASGENTNNFSEWDGSDHEYGRSSSHEHRMPKYW